MTKTAEKLPNSLIEAVRYFADEDHCFEFMKAIRWEDGVPVCPRCGVYETSFISTRKIWKCKGCKRQFSLKVGTIFEDSGLGFDKWLPAMWLIANSKNGISSCELARALGITQKSAWFMNHRIRLAMASGTFAKLSGTVETDETYVGGLAKNMHAADRKAKGRGGFDKVAIHGAVERGGKVVAAVVEDATMKSLVGSIYNWVESGSTVYSDQWRAYNWLVFDYSHNSVNHRAGEFVRGEVHTNTMESFWNLYKRAWKGTYTHNLPEHTDRYIAERTFSYNHRDLTDLQRMIAVTSTVAGQRLTYADLKVRS
jgi:transposase-like protein